MQNLSDLQSLGFALPSPAYLFGLLVFGLVGWFAFRYGKTAQVPAIRWIGVALMVYPYAIDSTVWLYAIGVLLTGAAWYLRP